MDDDETGGAGPEVEGSRGDDGVGGTAVDDTPDDDTPDDDTPDDDTPDPLLPWALASFHVAALAVAGVLLLHGVGALGSLLQGVGTATGLGLYLALWVATWRTNVRWVAEADLTRLRRTVVPGAKWGAVTGLVFFYALLVVVAVSTGELLFVLVLLVAGTLVSPLVGAVVGTGFAVADYLVVRAARRVA